MQVASKLTCGCGVTLIATAATKKGNYWGFDQRERVAVFWFLFCVKRGTAGVGRGAPPCSSQRYCEVDKAMSGLGGTTPAGRGLRAAPSVGFADSSL